MFKGLVEQGCLGHRDKVWPAGPDRRVLGCTELREHAEAALRGDGPLAELPLQGPPRPHGQVGEGQVCPGGWGSASQSGCPLTAGGVLGFLWVPPRWKQGQPSGQLAVAGQV